MYLLKGLTFWNPQVKVFLKRLENAQRPSSFASTWSWGYQSSDTETASVAASNHWSWPRSPSNGSDRLIGPHDWSIFWAFQPMIARWKPGDLLNCGGASDAKNRRSRSESMTGFLRGRSRLGEGPKVKAPTILLDWKAFS